MAQLIFNIPDAVLPRVLDGFASHFGYLPTDGTKQQFIKKVITQFIFSAVKESEARVAVKDAQVTSDASVDSAIIIT